MSRCVILSAGPVKDPARLCPLLRPDDWIIAADGGWGLAQALRAEVSLLIADFDSLPPAEAVLSEVPEIIRLPVEKDWTDTMAAAMEGIRRGYREFLILGGTGGRLDHTVANFAVLYYLVRQGARACMADEQNRVELRLPGSYLLEPQEGYKFSLFPYAGEVTGLTERQGFYPLDNATLTPDNTLGISNEFLKDPVKNTLLPAEISFKSGVLMIFLSKD